MNFTLSELQLLKKGYYLFVQLQIKKAKNECIYYQIAAKFRLLHDKFISWYNIGCIYMS